MIAPSTLLAAMLLCARHGDPTGGMLGSALVAAQWGPGGIARESARRRLPRLLEFAVRAARADARGAWVDLGWELP